MKSHQAVESTRYRLTRVIDVKGRGQTTDGPTTVSAAEAERLLKEGHPAETTAGNRVISWTLEEIHTLTTTTVLATEKGIT